MTRRKIYRIRVKRSFQSFRCSARTHNGQRKCNTVSAFYLIATADAAGRTGWGSANIALIAVAVVALIASASILSFVAAFAGVARPSFRGGFVSITLAWSVAMLLTALTQHFLPGVAREFTPVGLQIICALITILVIAIPMMQYTWNTGYLRVLSSIVGVVGLAFVVALGIRLGMHPDEGLNARPLIPQVFTDAEDLEKLKR